MLVTQRAHVAPLTAKGQSSALALLVKLIKL